MIAPSRGGRRERPGKREKATQNEEEKGREKARAAAQREKDRTRRQEREREGERVKVSAHNRIVTCTSSSCFHNYGLLKIRIGARRQRKAHYRSLGNVRARARDDDESTGKMIPHLRDEA